MSLDQSKVGRVVAEQMEAIENDYGDDCEIGDVCTIVEVIGPHGSHVRVRSSDMRPHSGLGLIRKATRRETLDREEALSRVQLLVDTCTKLSYEDLVHPARHPFRVVKKVDDRGGEQIVASRDFIALWGRSRKFTHVAGDTPHSAKTLRRAARKTLLRHGLVVQGIVTRREKMA